MLTVSSTDLQGIQAWVDDNFEVEQDKPLKRPHNLYMTQVLLKYVILDNKVGFLCLT